MGEKLSFISTLNIAHTKKIMVWVVYRTVWYCLSYLWGLHISFCECPW